MGKTLGLLSLSLTLSMWGQAPTPRPSARQTVLSPGDGTSLPITGTYTAASAGTQLPAGVQSTGDLGFITSWTASVEDPVNRVRVQEGTYILFDTSPLDPAKPDSKGWNHTFTEGRHILSTTWLDGTNSWRQGSSGSVYVDLTPPAASLSLSGTDWVLNASDAIGLGRIELWADSGSGYGLYDTPLSVTAPGTTSYSQPIHLPAATSKVIAKVYDLAGHLTTTAPVDVQVNTYFGSQRWATGKGNFGNSTPGDFQYVAGDFNGDGLTDIARIFNDGGYASIDVFLSTGTSFTVSRWVTRQGGFWSGQKWIAGDFDGDGRCDLANVFSDNGQASIDVHLSQVVSGANTFVSHRWATAQGGFWSDQKWRAGDFNGDGRCDLANVFSDNGSASIDIHLSQPNNTFSSARWATRQGLFWNDQQWIAKDFNGDGKADLANVFQDTAGTSVDVHISLNGSFVSSRWATAVDSWPSNPRWIGGDFNRHGVSDLVLVFGEDSDPKAAMDVLTNTTVNASPTFVKERWATGQGGFTVSQIWLAGDFNGDGYPDLACVFDDNGLASVDMHPNQRFK